MTTRPRTPLRQRSFALLWTGGLINDLGDWTLLIALPVFVFEMTGSALVTSTVFVVELIPGLIAGQVAGVVVDRWDRRRILVVSGFVQATCLLPLLAVTPDRLWIVYLVAAVESCLARLCAPAKAALIPSLVDADQLTAANSLGAVGDNLARLAGSPLGGVVLQVLGLTGVVAVDALTYVVSSLLIAAIGVPPHPAAAPALPGVAPALPEVVPAPLNAPAPPNVPAPPNAPGLPEVAAAPSNAPAPPNAPAGSSFVADWLDGLRTIGRNPRLRAVVLIGALSQVSQGVFVVLFVVFVLERLHGGSSDVGLIRGVQAIGGVAGGILVGAVASRTSARSLIGWGFICFGLISLLTWNLPALTTAIGAYVVLFVIVGAPGVATGAGLLTAVQALTPPSHLGRVFAAFDTAAGALAAVGVVAAGALADRFGVTAILDIQASIYVFCGILALVVLRSRLVDPLPSPT